METCPNCASSLTDEYQYCPQCGQKIHLHRLNLPEIGHEAFHAVTHADKGLLLLIRNLALRPGVVAREYILETKRRRYFNPFTFLVLVLSFILTVNAIVHPYTHSAGPGSATASPAGSGSSQVQQDPHYQAIITRRDAFFSFLEKRANLVILLSIPIFALIYWLLFRAYRIYYAEILVAQVFFSGFYCLVLTIILTPLVHQLPGGFWYGGLQLGFQFIYLSWAYRQFFWLTHRPSWWKIGAATLLAILVWTIFSTGGGFIYIAYGGL